MNAATMPRPADTTLVLGLGKTGYSVIRHLAARGAGAITAADSRARAPCMKQVRERYPRVEVISGRLPLDTLGRYARVVVSPGVALGVALSERAAAVSDIQLFAEAATAPVVAITGSNGKSSVTTMVAAMLGAAGYKALSGGNLGTPALDLLARPVPDFYVLEVSSFQLENTPRLAAAAAAVLNISPDHMDRHHDLAAYAAVKARALRAADTCVLSRDDGGSAALRRAHPSAITFGLGRPEEGHYGIISRAGRSWLCRGATPLADCAALTITAPHHLSNALAAWALTRAVAPAAAPEALVRALRAWRAPPHRCESLGDIRGVRWVNDSKGTNVAATVAALAGCREGVILIAGGRGKGADFTPLRDAAAGRVRHAVLFGEDAAALAAALDGVAAITRTDDLAAATAAAAAAAAPGETVLFSPACASFDMFRDYAARGAAFKALVGALRGAP